jgi:hypothetical protein
MTRTFSTLVIVLFCIAATLHVQAQTKVYSSTVKSIKLFRSGDQTSFPIIQLGSPDVLQLEFDDLDARVKNFYYSFQLCDANWTPSMLTSFDYIRGFQSQRITTYRNSSLVTIPYVHYQATIPDRNSAPSRAGNYLLRVFLNNDTTQMVFTSRFVVATNLAKIGAVVQQPFNSTLFRTGQKLQLAVTTDQRIKVMSPQDLKVVVLQNQNFQTSLFIDRPTIWRGNYFEYSDEAITGMEAAREFRWLDMRSLRLRSDRMEVLDNRKDSVHVYVKTEGSRTGQPFVYYRDINGSYTIETFESINPFWQGDYAYTHFTYVPPGGRPIEGSQVYIFGEMTHFASDTTGLMQFNTETGAYEKTMLLKQGYYNYLYATRPLSGGPVSFSQTEGNNWSTENIYTVLVYYRPFGARADECIGYTTLSSVFQR